MTAVRDEGANAASLPEANGHGPAAVEEGLAWYVVYSKPHREAWAEACLRRKGIEVFYPQLVLPEWSAGGGRAVPLFPSYLFVRIVLPRRFHDVAWSPGINRFVGANGTPTPIDDEVVAFLRRHAGPDGRLRARPALAAGQEVEIASGPFAGLVAIIQDPPDARGRIKVLMRLLNRQLVRVHVPLRFVKNSWIA